MKRSATGFRPYLATTFLVGLGFFTMGLMDSLYDVYVPQFLRPLLVALGADRPNTWIGLIMTLDNGFALFLIPIVSHLSDNTRTRIGRRMPYILVTLPLSALFFALIPFAADFGTTARTALVALIAVLFLLNVSKQSARGPVVALMPDTIPGEFRSEGNGVINTMGGIAAIVGTIALAPLMDLSFELPVIGDVQGRLPFVLAGVLVVVATILLGTLVRERQRATVDDERREPILASLKLIAGAHDRSALWVLLSIFFWFLGYQGILPFVGLYAVDVLGTTEGMSGVSVGMVAIAYTVFAIPSGYVAHRVGRRRTIRTSLIVTAALTTLMFFQAPLVASGVISGPLVLGIFWLLLFVFGVFWGAIITNSFPMLWQMATFANIGIYTGLYYFFSQGAAIIAPPITGAIVDTAGYPALFLYCAGCLLVAFALMGLVTGGEPEAASLAGSES